MVFVPLGLIAVFGASRIMKSLQDNDLVAKRAALNEQQHSLNPPVPVSSRCKRNTQSDIVSKGK